MLSSARRPRRIARPVVWTALILVAALAGPAGAQTSIVLIDTRSVPSSGWLGQRWAPLTLVFRTSQTPEYAELFCNEAGPRFRAEVIIGANNSIGVEGRAYAQAPSNQWTCRLFDADGSTREFPFELPVDFSARPPPCRC